MSSIHHNTINTTYMYIVHRIHCGNERFILKENGQKLNELIIWFRTVSK